MSLLTAHVMYTIYLWVTLWRSLPQHFEFWFTITCAYYSLESVAAMKMFAACANLPGVSSQLDRSHLFYRSNTQLLPCFSTSVDCPMTNMPLKYSARSYYRYCATIAGSIAWRCQCSRCWINCSLTAALRYWWMESMYCWSGIFDKEMKFIGIRMH